MNKIHKIKDKFNNVERTRELLSNTDRKWITSNIQNITFEIQIIEIFQ